MNTARIHKSGFTTKIKMSKSDFDIINKKNPFKWVVDYQDGDLIFTASNYNDAAFMAGEINKMLLNYTEVSILNYDADSKLILE